MQAPVTFYIASLSLQPLYNDYRRVRQRTPDGRFALTHVDSFVASLLGSDSCCDITLPRLPHRWTLEAVGSLQPRMSVLEELAAEGGDVVDVEKALDAAAARAASAPAPPPPPVKPDSLPMLTIEAARWDSDDQRVSKRRSRTESAVCEEPKKSRN